MPSVQYALPSLFVKPTGCILKPLKAKLYIKPSQGIKINTITLYTNVTNKNSIKLKQKCFVYD